MSYTHFSMYMGFYDLESIHTSQYKELLTALPEHIITPSRYWLHLGGCYGNNKASLISDPVHCYIHALISRTIAKRDDSMGVVTDTEHFLLYNIFERNGLVEHSGSRYTLVGQAATESFNDHESDSEDYDPPSPATQLPSLASKSCLERLEEQISEVHAVQDTILA
ncbi:hypothetical protein J5N97_028259 [Dioscorea zingiberensis]|uniref:Uncharacterized protein n=1 Tax=Dioscorea zingiberensis TaxID=325984 RepID=A0A9D5H4Q5_9LILI|nr:hypothetical protein J5N97_028259 [Dioscorea zingiberensis]